MLDLNGRELETLYFRKRKKKIRPTERTFGARGWESFCHPKSRGAGVVGGLGLIGGIETPN